MGSGGDSEKRLLSFISCLSIHLPIRHSKMYLLRIYYVPGNALYTKGPSFPLYRITLQHLFESKILGFLPLIVLCSASRSFSFPNLLERIHVNTHITHNGRWSLSRDWTSMRLGATPPWLSNLSFIDGGYAHIGFSGCLPTSNFSTETVKIVFTAAATTPCLLLDTGLKIWEKWNYP